MPGVAFLVMGDRDLSSTHVLTFDYRHTNKLSNDYSSTAYYYRAGEARAASGLSEIAETE